MSQMQGSGGGINMSNNNSPSVLGPQDLGLGTSQSEAGLGTPSIPQVSGAHYHTSKPISVPGTSAAAGGSKTSHGHGGSQNSGGRGRWVNRILIRLGLRGRNQFKDVTSDSESQKRGSRKRLSSWLKRGLLRKEKKTKEKASPKVVPQTIIHDKVPSLEKPLEPKKPDTHKAKNRLSVVPEHPSLFKTGSKRTETPASQKIASDPKLDLDPLTPSANAAQIIQNKDEEQTPGERGLSLTGPNPRGVERNPSKVSRHENYQLPRHLEPASPSIADLYVASFQSQQPSNSQTAAESRREDGNGNLGLGLNAAAISALGKNGPSDPKSGKQPHRQVTAGWLASLPSESDISQLRRDSLNGPEAVKEIPGTPQFRQNLHQEPSFVFGNSGGFVRGTPSIQHLASSRHPIADAHAEEWRRRTVGGFPIPERYSSRWRPRSRCPSSRRRASIDSRQTTYNPYDLPRIPRQPLFTDLVDLLSLSKAVNSSLNNGNGNNAAGSGTNRVKSTAAEVSRFDSFSSTISTSNKGTGGSGDWSSYIGAGHGENTTTTVLGRSGSGSALGSRLAQQTSSSRDGSTITNTTVATAGPLFQNYLLPSEENGNTLNLSLSGGLMSSRDENEPQSQPRVDDKGKGKMKMTPFPGLTSHNPRDDDFNTIKPTSGIVTAAPVPRSSETSGRDRGSGDSSVPEAWWTNQGQPHGHLSYGYGFGSGRPSTPTSPMTRRREKWNVRKRRERENNR